MSKTRAAGLRGLQAAEPDNQLDVVVVGGACIDLVTRVAELPGEGETVFGTQLAARPGGKGLNQASAVAHAGGRAALVARAGDDDWGRLLCQHLIAAGVDVSAFTSNVGETAAVLVQVPASGNSAVTVTRASTALATLADIERAAPLLESATTALVQLELAPEVIEAALRCGPGVKIGTVVPPEGLSAELLAQLDLIVVNAREAGWLLGEPTEGMAGLTLARKLAQRVRAAVVTLGAGGAAYAGPEGDGCVAAARGPVIDTTGAGDLLVGVLTLGLARGDSLAAAVTASVGWASTWVAGRCGGSCAPTIHRVGLPTHCTSMRKEVVSMAATTVGFAVDEADRPQLDRLVEHFAGGNRSEFLRQAMRVMAVQERAERLRAIQAAGRAQLGRVVTADEVSAMVRKIVKGKDA